MELTKGRHKIFIEGNNIIKNNLSNEIKSVEKIFESQLKKIMKENPNKIIKIINKTQEISQNKNSFTFEISFEVEVENIPMTNITFKGIQLNEIELEVFNEIKNKYRRDEEVYFWFEKYLHDVGKL